MAGISLATMRTRIRQRTDNENSNFVTDAELTQLINTEYQELYARLVQLSLQRSEDVQTITANGAANYALDGDFYALIGVFRVEGDIRVRLERFSERFRPGSSVGPATQYRLQGFNIVLYPKPSSGTYEVLYIPEPGELVDDSDTLDGVMGWEELVVISAAIKVLEKEEADTSMLRADKEAMIRRIQDESAAVEFSNTIVVENVRTRALPTDEGDYVGYRGLRSWRLY